MRKSAHREHSCSAAVCVKSCSMLIGKSRKLCFAVVVLCSVIIPSGARRPTTNNDDDESKLSSSNFIDEIFEFSEAAKSGTAAYIQAAIPFRMFQCVRKMAILRCMKLFIWQKVENRTHFRNSGNLTKDFMDEFMQDDNRLPSLIDRRYAQLSDDELTKKLVAYFQRFFKDRDIKLHFLPGVMVQVVPNKTNKIKFSIKRKTVPARDRVTGRGDEEGDGKKKRKDKNKNSYKQTIIQMAVPIMVMPAILLGTFLPFLLPALKMATIMSMVLNNGALMAALMYAARTHVQNTDSEVVHYSTGTYH